jgi:hypothetical protein
MIGLSIRFVQLIFQESCSSQLHYLAVSQIAPSWTVFVLVVRCTQALTGMYANVNSVLLSVELCIWFSYKLNLHLILCDLQGVTKGARNKILISVKKLHERPAALRQIEKVSGHIVFVLFFFFLNLH